MDHRAVLTLKSASSHLLHFSSVLPRFDYVDHRPSFRFYTDAMTQQLTAEVTLPTAVDASVHWASSKHSWFSKRLAKSDEAYVSLYHAGLVWRHVDQLISAPQVSRRRRACRTSACTWSEPHSLTQAPWPFSACVFARTRGIWHQRSIWVILPTASCGVIILKSSEREAFASDGIGG